MLKRIASFMLVSLLAACGGGGGSGGSTAVGTASAGTTAGTSAYVLQVDVQRTGTATAQVSSTETVQAVAIVASALGVPIEGVVVTFTETQSSLLKFAPKSATALTDANGRASVDVAAATTTNTGATTVAASASLAGGVITSQKSIQITAGAATGPLAATPAAINFVGSVPANSAIVIKGTGGNGRSESAILTFRVVDASNGPISLVQVAFVFNTTKGAALLQSSALSNADGLVSTTVSSGSAPESIVVSATVKLANGGQITSQSDTLIVSNSVPLDGGFEIVASKYNIDGRKTGDPTTVTAFVRDTFGNPVPDGVAVSFTTDFGVIAKSTLGGCTTINGTCFVEFKVQDPRGDGIATVTGVVRPGGTTELVKTLQINMAGATGTSYLAMDVAGTLRTLTLNNCKQAFELLISDGAGHAVATGTAISSPFGSSNVTVNVKIGSPVLDQLAHGFPPNAFGIEVDLSSTILVPACRSGGTVKATTPPTFTQLQFRTPAGLTSTQRVELLYPQ